MFIFPLPGDLMLCTYMADWEYELSNTSRFGFQSTRIMIVLMVLSKVVVQLS